MYIIRCALIIYTHRECSLRIDQSIFYIQYRNQRNVKIRKHYIFRFLNNKLNCTIAINTVFTPKKMKKKIPNKQSTLKYKPNARIILILR